MSGSLFLPAQHEHDGLPSLSPEMLHERREAVFLLFAGLFLGTLAMLNILGVTRFLDLSFTVPILAWHVPMHLAIGVLPYPVTFLCTDFISELYGRRRANWVVFVGFLLNIWVAFILWLGGVLPQSPSGMSSAGQLDAFARIRQLAFGGIAASMIAYLAAQFIDVQLFHFWKRLTRGKHLWLRNNGSTLVSQLVDTIAVILITHYYARGLPIEPGRPLAAQLLGLIAAAYAYKLIAAALDTIPFYWGTHHLVRYLRLAPPTGAGPE